MAAEEGPLRGSASEGRCPRRAKGLWAYLSGPKDGPMGDPESEAGVTPEKGPGGDKRPGVGGGSPSQLPPCRDSRCPHAEAGFTWRWGRTVAGVGRGKGGALGTEFQRLPSPAAAPPEAAVTVPPLRFGAWGSYYLRPQETSPSEAEAGTLGATGPLPPDRSLGRDGALAQKSARPGDSGPTHWRPDVSTGARSGPTCEHPGRCSKTMEGVLSRAPRVRRACRKHRLP